MSSVAPPRLPDYLQHIAQAIQLAVDWDLIWATIQHDLPALYAQISALLSDQGAAGA